MHRAGRWLGVAMQAHKIPRIPQRWYPMVHAAASDNVEQVVHDYALTRPVTIQAGVLHQNEPQQGHLYTILDLTS